MEASIRTLSGQSSECIDIESVLRFFGTERSVDAGPQNGIVDPINIPRNPQCFAVHLSDDRDDRRAVVIAWQGKRTSFPTQLDDATHEKGVCLDKKSAYPKVKTSLRYT
jgi:hypothetical protein